MADRSVLITGCSSGIGRATAARLARAGWTVWATARRPETLAGLAELGCRTVALDVTDEDSMRAAVDIALATGPLDALVNNAGYEQLGAMETMAMDDLRRQFETNVFGLTRMCQLVLPAMRARRQGRIVNISSMAAHLTFPGGGAYHATKAAVNHISEALRFEVGGFGVKVVIIEPGLITTAFDTAATASLDPADAGPYAEFNAHVASVYRGAYGGPLARLGGPPESVAKAIEKALTARHPRHTYAVTPSAPLSRIGRSLAGSHGWDLAMRTAFRRPQ
jgi:NAD(P)-dependent dehydrogenase (short-subunit alcohol dehydrogenase family)